MPSANFLMTSSQISILWFATLSIGCSAQEPVYYGEEPPVYYNYDSGDDCLERESCSYLDWERNCFCDKLCQVYADCCADANLSYTEEFCGYSVDIIQMSSKCSGFSEGDHSINFNSLVLMPPEQYGADVWYSVISFCPMDFPDTSIRHLCENETMSEEDPLAGVLVSGEPSGLLFRNVFCASCHGAFTKDDKVVFWDQSYGCDCGDCWPNDYYVAPWVTRTPQKSVNETWESIDLETCAMQLSQPTGVKTPHACMRTGWGFTYIDECDSNWVEKDGGSVEELCSNHTNFRYTDRGYTIFRNEYCAQCNYQEQHFLTCEDPFERYPGIIGPPPSMRLLLDINEGTLSKLEGYGVVDDTSARQCPSNAVWDFHMAACRAVFCPIGQEMSENGDCEILLADFSEVNDTALNITCEYVKLNRSDFELLEDGYILILASNESVGRGDYTWIDSNTLAVCVESFIPGSDSTYVWILDTDNYLAEAYLTLVGYSLSLVGLFIVFVVYLVLPQLRNVPGKCLMNLVTALFLAQLLFLLLNVPEADSFACICLAVIVHYLYLAAFFWMNVLAFDIWHTFQYLKSCLRKGLASSYFFITCMPG